MKKEFLSNRISDDIMDFKQSLYYYQNAIREDSEINDIYDLCDYLNELDMYGCGSSFEIVTIEF